MEIGNKKSGITNLSLRTNWLRACVLVVLAFCGVACSVNYSFNNASIPDTIRSVSIKTFPSFASLAPPNLSQDFSEELRDIFVRQSNLNLRDAPADVEYSGKIVNYRVSPIAVGGTEQATQNRLTITVQVKFTNNVIPEQSFDKNFEQFQDFDAAQNLANVQDELIQQINEQLTQDIFNQSFGDW